MCGIVAIMLLITLTVNLSDIILGNNFNYGFYIVTVVVAIVSSLVTSLIIIPIINFFKIK